MRLALIGHYSVNKCNQLIWCLWTDSTNSWEFYDITVTKICLSHILEQKALLIVSSALLYSEVSIVIMWVRCVSTAACKALMSASDSLRNILSVYSPAICGPLSPSLSSPLALPLGILLLLSGGLRIVWLWLGGTHACLCPSVESIGIHVDTS